MRQLLFLSVFFFPTTHSIQAEDKPLDIPLSKLGSQYRLIGKLREPLGTVVTVQGIVVEGAFKGYEGGPNVRVQRINGRATQDDIQIRLHPYFGKFGEKAFMGKQLPKLEDGQTYEFEGYESGEFVGIPKEAYERAGRPLQSTGFYFSHHYIVYQGKKIGSVVWAPADFVDREVLLKGRAVNRNKMAYIDAAYWQLLVDAKAIWPKELDGKNVEGRGIVRKTVEATTYQLENGTTRPVALQDQLRHQVSLRGRAWSMNGHWWFEYRGIDLYVEGMKDLPNWSANLHGEAVLITGVLEEALLPALDQIVLKVDRDLKKYFIVRKPSWKPIDALLSPERVDR